MSSTALIRCERVSRLFVMGEQDFYALRDVSIAINAGELVAIVGASGSGKSSFLNVIGGLDSPTAGEVWIGGDELSRVSEPELARIRNEKIGFVFQQFNLLPRYDALRNVEMPMIYSGVAPAERRARSTELLRTLGLGEHINKVPLKMSGGQQQRVAIARALCNDPRIILADEPTGALDSKSSADVMHLLISLNRERQITVLIVTHDEKIAQRCDRIVRFADGKIVEDYANEARADEFASNLEMHP
jgi:putative ABC transport system ATP-binding protein